MENEMKINQMLDRMAKSQEPELYIKELIQMVAMEQDQTRYLQIFPRLAQICMESQSLNMARFLIDIKMLSYQMDLSLLETKVLKEYFLAQMKLAATFPPFVPRNQIDWEPEFVSIYMDTCLKVRSFSDDLLAFYYYGFFDQAVPITCCHCGNDLHSVYIDEKDSAPAISKRMVEEQGWNRIDYDNIYLWYSSALTNIGEEHISKKIPYLYGSYVCSVCQKENVVIEAIKKSIRSKHNIVALNLVYLNKIQEIYEEIDQEEDRWYDSMWYFASYLASLYHQIEGKNSLRACYFQLHAASKVSEFYGEEWQGNLINELKQKIQVHSLETEDLADANYLMAINLIQGESLGKDKQLEAIQYFEKSYQWYATVLGERHKKTLEVKKNLLDAKTKDPQTNLSELLVELEKLEGDASSTLKDISDFQHLVARKYAERELYQKAIEYYGYYLEYLHTVYGGESTLVAEAKRRMADFYVSSKNFDQAVILYEEALAIQVKELGSQYLLPPIFRNVMHQGLKIFGVAKGDHELQHKACAASESYGDIANIQLLMRDTKAALVSYQKALELIEWVLPDYHSKLGNLHLTKGACFVELQKEKEAMQEWGQAIVLLETASKEARHPDEIVSVRENFDNVIECVKEVSLEKEYLLEFLGEKGHKLYIQYA